MQRACLQSRRNGFSGMLAVHMGKHGHKRQIAPETCFLRVYAAPVGSGGDIVRDAGNPRDAAVRRLRGAQCSGMVQADAVENVPVILPKLFQVRIAEAAVIASLSARTQHRLTDVVQQTAEADAHAFCSQGVSHSFLSVVPCRGCEWFLQQFLQCKHKWFSVPLRGVGCFGKAAHSFWCNRKKNCQLCYFIVSYWQMFINSKLRNCKVPCEAHKTAT